MRVAQQRAVWSPKPERLGAAPRRHAKLGGATHVGLALVEVNRQRGCGVKRSTAASQAAGPGAFPGASTNFRISDEATGNGGGAVRRGRSRIAKRPVHEDIDRRHSAAKSIMASRTPNPQRPAPGRAAARWRASSMPPEDLVIYAGLEVQNRGSYP